MTGLTLNDTTGGTLGGPNGGTLGGLQSEYYLDGLRLPEVTAETRTWQTLELTFRAETQTLLDRLRRLKSDEGKVDTLTTDTGGFTAVDRANGANTFSLAFPARRQPLRQDSDVHVASYDEELVSQEVQEWDVTVSFVADANRTEEPDHPVTLRNQTPDQLADSGGTLNTANGMTLGGSNGGTLGNYPPDTIPLDWWTFDTRLATLATDRVSADFLGTGRDGVERFEVTATLSFEQAHVFEAALNRLGAIRIQTVSDGTNLARDESTDGAASLTIDAPDDQSAVSDGEYVVEEWTGERLNDAFQRYEFVVIQSA